MSRHMASSQRGARRGGQGSHQSQAQGSQGTGPQNPLAHGSPHAASPTQSCLSPQQQADIAAAETFWRQSLRDWFPNLHSQTYFVPPLHFNRVSYSMQNVSCQPVLVPQAAPDQAQSAAPVVVPQAPPSHAPDPLPASLVYLEVPAGDPITSPQDSDARDDNSVQQVRHFMEQLAEKLKGKERAMFVLCQLDFRKYLGPGQVNPITAAAVCLLRRPATRGRNFEQGDFDMLIINEPFSLVVIEVKSVGASSQTRNLDKAVLKVTKKAIAQLDKEEEVLKHLTSDLAPFRITKSLALPNIQSQQLEGILATDQQLLQDLCQCLGVQRIDAAAAVARCITADDISKPESSVWWQRTVADHGPDASMTPELYERLAARFCGPATTIEVPTVTAPRRAVGLRTLREGVALTGTQMSLLTLYPEQVDLVSRPDPRLYLLGPPGTGKTIVLLLKAIQWGHRKKDVHVVSTWSNSRAATRLIEYQLLHSPNIGFTATSLSDTTTPTRDTTTPPPSTTTPPTCTTTLPSVTTTPPSDTTTLPASTKALPSDTTTLSANTTTPPSDTTTPPSDTTTPPSGTLVTAIPPSSTLVTTTSCGATSTSTTASPRLYTHFYDFNEERDLNAAVAELASFARDKELFVIIDEAYSYGRNFPNFCTGLYNRVPSLHLWAAAMLHNLDVDDDFTHCMAFEQVTVPVRCPPTVQREVARSELIDGGFVPKYSDTPAPSATDGPPVMQVLHWERFRTDEAPLPGHKGDSPQDCVGCAEAVVNLLVEELRLGQTGDQKLEYRDTLMMFDDPREDLPVVACLRARGVPVQLVSSDADESSVRDMALAVHDAVAVTDCNVVNGLERRVVVVTGSRPPEDKHDFDFDDANRLDAMSRCTSLLIWEGVPVVFEGHYSLHDQNPHLLTGCHFFTDELTFHFRDWLRARSPINDL